ncbi:unnamed protein product [Prunus armeniaca]
MSEANFANYMAEFISKQAWTKTIGMEEEIQLAPAKLSQTPPEVQDPLEEVNLGTEDDPRPIFISGLLEQFMRTELIFLLKEFKDCFAWHYHEMPGLDRSLVEHRLPINEGYKQKVTKAERVCVDYVNLNEANPKDEYPMSMVDTLIDGATHNKILSFMDGNAGYNQIMVAEADIHKKHSECRCYYEYIVMPFRLKNAGATYQSEMNTIFHDMIGPTLEVYIDDVVIKSQEQQTHIEDLRKAFIRIR